MILVPDGDQKRKAEERVDNVKRSKPSETEEVHNSSDSEDANLSQDSEWNLSEFEAECMMEEIKEVVKKQVNNTVDILLKLLWLL